MSSISPLEEQFSTEFLRWRYFEALSTSFLLQLFVSSVVCSAFKTICFDFVWNPLMWVLYFIDGIFSPSWFFRFLIPAICFIILTRVHVRSYSVTWWIPERRLQYISQYLQPRRILYSFAIIFFSILLLQYYATLIHPELSTLTIECPKNASETCINHQTLLVIYLGIVFGARLSVKYFLHNYNAIQFPVSQVNLLVRLKSRLKIRTALESCTLFNVNIATFGFIYVTYLLCGGFVSQWIGLFVETSHISNSSSVWFILPVIFDIRFIFTLIISLILLTYGLHCFFLDFQEIIAKRIDLPISYDDLSVIASETQIASNWTLTSGMVSSCELLQLLAFKHFKEIAADETAWGASYRSQIFAISQPGGHPRNWQSIVNPCLNLIRKFSERLRQTNLIEEKESSPTVGIIHRQETDINKNKLHQKFQLTIAENWSKVKERMRQLPFIWYLLADIPDAKNRQLFAESQAVIWAVEGLSNIVAKSYTDDQFGVVQKNIADILTTLVQTQMMVEKVSRVLPNRRVTQKLQMCPQDHQLRRSLRMTLRSSLYIITASFKESIREIPVTEDIKNKLESYLAFQEG